MRFSPFINTIRKLIKVLAFDLILHTMKIRISLFTGLPHDSSTKLVTCRRLRAIQSRLHFRNSPEMCLAAQSADHSSLSSLSLRAFSFMRLPNETVIAITLLLYLERSGGGRRTMIIIYYLVGIRILCRVIPHSLAQP